MIGRSAAEKYNNMVPTNTHKNMLRRHHLFRAMGENELEGLLSNTRMLHVNKGEFLFQQGEPAHCFFFVVAGGIKLFRTLPDGTEKIIELIRPDNVFAEALMFMSKDRFPVSAQGIEATELLCFPTQEFLMLLRSNQELSLALLGDLSVRLHQRLNEIEVLSLKNSTHRVVRYLLTELSQHGKDTSFDLPVAKRLIAAQLSIQPETFSRIISKLQSENIIRVDGKQVTIVDLPKLESYE